MLEAAQPARDELLFDAVLYPHRSLGRRGVVVVMAVLSVAGLGVGIVFLLAGAWPVLAFFAPVVALVWLAFRLNDRAGRLVARVRLTCAALDVERIAPSGQARRWRFQPYWLRVELDAAGEHHCRLALRGGGGELVIGSFLAPGERASLCAALRAALARCGCAPARIG
jgi:uncharacterized membrane protein